MSRPGDFFDDLPPLFEEGELDPAPAPARRTEESAKPQPPPKRTDGEMPVARWVPIRCPNCGGRNVPSDGHNQGTGIRYHRCRNCLLRFKSQECAPEYVVPRYSV